MNMVGANNFSLHNRLSNLLLVTMIIPFTLKKRKENGRRYQIQVRESIMQGESINTPHIFYTQREPFS